MGEIFNKKILKERRKELRNELTPAEASLWKVISRKQLEGRKFRRQESIGNYIVDFYCPSEKLVIELDGEEHDTTSGFHHDKEREAYLASLGLTVLRFENEDIFQNPEAVLEEIKNAFKTPLLSKEGLGGGSAKPNQDFTPPPSRDLPLSRGGVENTTFKKIFYSHHWDDVKASIYNKTSRDVEHALKKAGNRNLEDFKALISPAAAPYLEQMAALSHQLTKKRFGNTIQMYVPMYLSNECQNICTYCGFSFDNKIPRRTLTDAEILKEVEIIKEMGYDHILLVTGEANHTVGVDYFKNAIQLIKKHFSQISIEVQPLDEHEYKALIDEGLNTVLVYQETYHQEDYKKHHPKGKKSNFDYRLETPDRLGRAGIYKMGLGVLIGLEDWRTDSFFTAMHLEYLERKYWQTKYSISFPRLRPFSGGLDPKVEMTDRELVQLICAYRIYDEEVELSMSTRESEKFRNNIIKLGVTSISAGSKTDPGGYAATEGELEQFEISDERSPQEIAAMIKAQGYEPVWKDWDRIYS